MGESPPDLIKKLKYFSSNMVCGMKEIINIINIINIIRDE